MRYFDLHCDTLSRCAETGASLLAPEGQLSLSAGQDFSAWAQCFAAFIPDTLRGEEAFRYFEKLSDVLIREVAQHPEKIKLCRTGEDIKKAEEQGVCAAILTVEGGAALGGALTHVDDLLNRGVRLFTLTWNGKNELGGGILDEQNTGLTEFGRQAVSKLTQGGCVMDVSHASEALFWDLCTFSDQPFVASHSNSRTVCGAVRNLTDDQFDEIVRRGGLVGLNFCRDFLRDPGDKARMTDILRHADYFLSRGGEHTLCMGSDFDGCQIPPDLHGVAGIPLLMERFQKELGLSDNQLNALFYRNAYTFFQRFS